MRHINLTMLAFFLVTGCSARPLAPPIGKIVVREFEIGDAITAVSRFGPATEHLGMVPAEQIARYLAARDRNAEAVPASAPPDGDLLVSGRITRIDGGNRALRALIGFGAGGSTCAVQGQVTRADGTPVGTFNLQRKRKATGYFWARYGESAERQITACLRSIGTTIGVMVDQGRYDGGTPAYLQVVPAAAAPPPQLQPSRGTATDRLRELDRMRQQGLLTEEEYREKRQRIIEEL
jgi:hypothetical protein